MLHVIVCFILVVNNTGPIFDLIPERTTNNKKTKNRGMYQQNCMLYVLVAKKVKPANDLQQCFASMAQSKWPPCLSFSNCVFS